MHIRLNFVPAGRNIRWSSSRLPGGRPLLLLLSSRVIRFGSGGPGARDHLHHLHAGLMCLLLQNLDRSLRLLRERCESDDASSAAVMGPGSIELDLNKSVLPLNLIQVAKQLKEQQMVMKGHRETSMVHELNR